MTLYSGIIACCLHISSFIVVFFVVVIALYRLSSIRSNLLETDPQTGLRLFLLTICRRPGRRSARYRDRSKRSQSFSAKKSLTPKRQHHLSADLSNTWWKPGFKQVLSKFDRMEFGLMLLRQLAWLLCIICTGWCKNATVCPDESNWSFHFTSSTST